MTKDEALNYALQLVSNLRTHSWTVADTQFVITAIKEALAQSEQDGECKFCTDGCPACDARKLPEQKSVAMADYMALTEKYVALKAAQRTWIGLTDDDIHSNICDCVDDGTFNMKCAEDYAKAIEAKLKEKNT